MASFFKFSDKQNLWNMKSLHAPKLWLISNGIRSSIDPDKKKEHTKFILRKRQSDEYLSEKRKKSGGKVVTYTQNQSKLSSKTVSRKGSNRSNLSNQHRLSDADKQIAEILTSHLSLKRDKDSSRTTVTFEPSRDIEQKWKKEREKISSRTGSDSTISSTGKGKRRAKRNKNKKVFSIEDMYRFGQACIPFDSSRCEVGSVKRMDLSRSRDNLTSLSGSKYNKSSSSSKKSEKSWAYISRKILLPDGNKSMNKRSFLNFLSRTASELNDKPSDAVSDEETRMLNSLDFFLDNSHNNVSSVESNCENFIKTMPDVEYSGYENLEPDFTKPHTNHHSTNTHYAEDDNDNYLNEITELLLDGNSIKQKCEDSCQGTQSEMCLRNSLSFKRHIGPKTQLDTNDADISTDNISSRKYKLVLNSKLDLEEMNMHINKSQDPMKHYKPKILSEDSQNTVKKTKFDENNRRSRTLYHNGDVSGGNTCETSREAFEKHLTSYGPTPFSDKKREEFCKSPNTLEKLIMCSRLYSKDGYIDDSQSGSESECVYENQAVRLCNGNVYYSINSSKESNNPKTNQKINGRQLSTSNGEKNEKSIDIFTSAKRILHEDDHPELKSFQSGIEYIDFQNS